MEEKRPIDIARKVQELLEASRIVEALKLLDELVTASADWQIREEYEQLSTNYRLLLQYMSQGVMDPARHSVLSRLTQSLLTLTWRSYNAVVQPSSHELFFTRRRELADTPLSRMAENYRTELNKYALLKSVPSEAQDKTAVLMTLRRREALETDIFNKLWSSYPTSGDDAEVASNLLTGDVPDHCKSLVLGALFLGLAHLYDERKLTLLLDAYCNVESVPVKLRALTYALLALRIHRSHAVLGDNLEKHLRAVAEMPHSDGDVATVQYELARSRNTDNITRRVKEEIIPGIMKMSPDLMRKIRDKGATFDIADLEANPEWQEMLENSGIAKRMEEFNELTLDGSDVFAATFSRLKSYPFFNTLSNWFMPFHAEHSVVADNYAGSDSLNKIIGHAPFLCNSDKFSFLLSLSSMPESQRQAMSAQMAENEAAIAEIKGSELPHPAMERARTVNHCVQDLYRFFTIFSRRREFINMLDTDMDLTTLPVLGELLLKATTLQVIAELYFKNEFWDDAIKYYNYMLEHSSEADPRIHQKIGFAHQSMGRTREALASYQRYELAHDNDVWTMKHIAACYRDLKRLDKALDYYKRCEAVKPGNIATNLNIGHCLLEQGNAEDALQYYYKVDLMEGAKHRAWRPIAWCTFLTGNTARSLEYYDRIVNDDTPTMQDHLNRGHVLLCSHQLPEAIASYRQALALDSKGFRQAFDADAKHLVNAGIEASDLPLIADAVASAPTP